MSDNATPPISSEDTGIPLEHQRVNELFTNAQVGVAKITELVESAKSAAFAVVESQRLTATANADAQTKLSEITTAASSVVESQKLAATAQTDAQTKLSEITAVASAAAESQKAMASSLADAQAKLSEIAKVSTEVAAVKAKITDEQAVIATKSDHIQKAQEHADKVRSDLDRVLTTATQQATAAEAQNSRAQVAADSTATLLIDMQKNKVAVETDAAAIATARKTAEESTALLQGLADKATKVETRIAEYEKRLAELEEQCAIQLKTIDDLLPGATSAGLASAFDDRRKTFLKPHDRWQLLFIGSLLAIILLAAMSLWHLYHAGIAIAPSYDEVLRMWLSRLPVAGALVWLALHASRESALAKRLEEDYGYKSVIASSFQGFHKQMTAIGSAPEANKPLTKLCEDTLNTIASPPGRIYDKHKLTTTPADELTDAAKAAAKIVNPPKPTSK